MIISNLSVLIFNVLFYRTINAGKTPNKNEDQSVAGMFCLNVSKSSGEADDEGSPTRVSQVQLRQELKDYDEKFLTSPSVFLIRW